MKAHPLPRALSSFLGKGIILTGFLLASFCQAQTIYEVDDWYVANGKASGVTNGGSNSPAFQYTTDNTETGRVWAYFSDTPVQLVDGAKITLNATVTMTLSGAAQIPFLFGVYQAGARPTAPESNADRILAASTTTMRNWRGFFATTSDSSTVKDRVMRRVEADTANVTFDNVSVSNIGRSVMSNGFDAVTTFTSGVPVTLELSLERKGNDLVFSGQIAGDTFLGTYRDAFNGYSDTFDAVGFSTGIAGDGATLTSIAFSNVTVTVIPEASGVALGLLGGVVLLGVVTGRITK